MTGTTTSPPWRCGGAPHDRRQQHHHYAVGTCPRKSCRRSYHHVTVLHCTLKTTCCRSSCSPHRTHHRRSRLRHCRRSKSRGCHPRRRGGHPSRNKPTAPPRRPRRTPAEATRPRGREQAGTCAAASPGHKPGPNTVASKEQLPPHTADAQGP
jgi:hypothetical protein